MDRIVSTVENGSISVTILLQTSVPGILGGIVKGLKAGKISHANSTKISTSNFGHLEDIFFKPSLPESLPTVSVVADEKEVELDIGLLLNCIFVFFFRLVFVIIFYFYNNLNTFSL
jgi:hypothetical protein